MFLVCMCAVDQLTHEAGECSICLEDMVIGMAVVCDYAGCFISVSFFLR